MKPKTEMISLIFFIVFKEGFIQNVADGCADTQFCKVQKTKPRLFSVPISPIKSAPNASRKIFLEKMIGLNSGNKK